MRRHRKRHALSRRAVAALLAIALCLAGGIGYWLSARPSEDSVIIQDGGQTDGLLRVQLRSLGAPQSLTLTLDGIYAVEADPGFRFERGAVLHLWEESGAIWLACGDLTLNMGGTFTLTRHQAEQGQPNGIIIAETGRDTLYNGEMVLQSVNGAISALVRIHIEEYLYGVVPYEMSDSWPLEALKAQSIAARTYALGRKAARVGQEYDVVDTTADQVFRGFSADTSNAIAAVNATKGVVGMYNGAFATCYYSASNGGQTAMPQEIWGREGDYGYLDVRDDPYDLQNPLSVVRTMEINADGALMDEALASLCKAALSEQLATLGYSEDAEDIRIARVLAITPANPKGEAANRMYQTLTFTLSVEGRPWVERTAPQADEAFAPAQPTAEGETGLVLGEFEVLSAPLQADIETYGQLKTTFENMAINGGDYEMYTVVAVNADGSETDCAAADPTGEANSIAPSATDSTAPKATDESAESKANIAETTGESKSDPIAAETLPASEQTPAQAPTQSPVQTQVQTPVSFRIEARRFGHGVGMSQRGAQYMAGQRDFHYADILLFYYPGMDLVRYTMTEQPLTELAALPDGLGAARMRVATPVATPAPLPALEEGERYGTVVLSSSSSTLNVRKEPNTQSEILMTLIDGQRVILREQFVDWYSIRTAETQGYVSMDYIQPD